MTIARVRDERGSGLIGTIAGVAVTLGFLLLATQVLVHLYATTTITSVAQDAVRRAAAAESLSPDGRPTHRAIRRATERAEEMLGPAVRTEAFTWRIEGAHLELRVQTRTVRVLPTTGVWAGLLGFDRVDRTVRARIERPR